MRFFSYRATMEPGDEPGAIVVTFPDVPQIVTQGDNEADARAMASEALALTLLELARRGEPIPEPHARTGIPIPLDPEAAAKIALISAFTEAQISRAEFARRLGKGETEIRRMLDPDHATKIGPMSEALAVFGRRLVIGIDEAA